MSDHNAMERMIKEKLDEKRIRPRDIGTYAIENQTSLTIKTKFHTPKTLTLQFEEASTAQQALYTVQSIVKSDAGMGVEGKKIFPPVDTRKPSNAWC